MYRLIISSINMNSVSSKFDKLKTFVQGKIGILVVVATKLDTSLPESKYTLQN